MTCLCCRCFMSAETVADLLLPSPVLAVGEAVMLAQAPLFGLDDAIFLKLNQTWVRIPWLTARRANRDTNMLIVIFDHKTYIFSVALISIIIIVTITSKPFLFLNVSSECVEWTDKYILCMFVLPVISIKVQSEEVWPPGPISSFPCLLPLCLLQNKLFLCSFILVLGINCTGHMLPQPEGKANMLQCHTLQSQHSTLLLM